MSEDRIDPFWEFYYETGIDPTGGELDTGEEELIEDEEEFVEECCCHQGLSVGSLQETTDYVTLQVRRSLCFRCLHSCPKFAIQYGRNTKAHGQYLHPSISMGKINAAGSIAALDIDDNLLI